MEDDISDDGGRIEESAYKGERDDTAPSQRRRKVVPLKPKLHLSHNPSQVSQTSNHASLKEAMDDDLIDSEDDEPDCKPFRENIDTSEATTIDAEAASPGGDDFGAEKPMKFGFSSLLRQALEEKPRRPETGHLDLKILETRLDFHLSVCTCTILEEEHPSAEMRMVTTLFDSTADGLQTGRLVRIHPPWHELPELRGYGRVIFGMRMVEMLQDDLDDE